jgi:hypothetical protein
MNPVLRVGAALVILFGASANSCTSNPLPNNCGSFTFQPEDVGFGVPPGVQALFTLWFGHKSQGCPVTCGRHWFIQAIRPMDLDTGKFLHPNDTQQDRMTHDNDDNFYNGWAIDRKEDKNFGYYGVSNQFNLEPETPGDPPYQWGDGTLLSARMHDTVNRGDERRGKNIQVIGLTADVGMDPGTPCFGKILGLKKWVVVFAHDPVGDVDSASKPVELDAEPRDVVAFQIAVDEWNKHLDDGRQRLPNPDPSTSFSLP